MTNGNSGSWIGVRPLTNQELAERFPNPFGTFEATVIRAPQPAPAPAAPAPSSPPSAVTPPVVIPPEDPLAPPPPVAPPPVGPVGQVPVIPPIIGGPRPAQPPVFAPPPADPPPADPPPVDPQIPGQGDIEMLVNPAAFIKTFGGKVRTEIIRATRGSGTQNLLYEVPVGFTFYLTDFTLSSPIGANQRTQFMITDSQGLEQYSLAHLFANSSFGSYAAHSFFPPITILEGSRVVLAAVPFSGNAFVHGWVERNV